MIKKKKVIALICAFICSLSISSIGFTAESSSEKSPAWLKKLLKKQPRVYSIDLGSSSSAELKVLTETDENSERAGLTLCWITIPKNNLIMSVTDIRKDGFIRGYYPEIVKNKDVVIVNGSFFGVVSGNPYPIGLVVSNGKAISKTAKWKTGGMVIQSNGSIDIVPIKSFAFNTAIEQAIQSRPMLVFNGKMGINSDDGFLFNRTAIGIAGNDIVVAGAFIDEMQAVTLYEFASFLTTKKKDGGPEVDAALNMDGAGGAQLLFPALGLTFGEELDIYIPNTVHFSIRDENL